MVTETITFFNHLNSFRVPLASSHRPTYHKLRITNLCCFEYLQNAILQIIYWSQISTHSSPLVSKYLTKHFFQMSVIVQYVLIRGDLIKTLNWPVGAVVAQACHACTAVIHMFYNDPCTQSYLMDLDSMHKIILEVCFYLSNR